MSARAECAVGAIVIDAGALLLVKRDREPARGQWSLPGGRVEAGESLREAVVREVQEELGITVRPLARVWECASSDGAYWLHWWLAEPLDDEVSLLPNAREVDGARWLRPADFRNLGRVFEPDVRFFEEIFPTLSGC